MINFISNKEYDLLSLCGNTKRLTVYIDRYNKIDFNIPGSKKKNPDTEFIYNNDITIDNICNYYKVNKWYIPGIYSDERILQVCILPVNIIYLYEIKKGYLVFTFSKDNKNKEDIISVHKIGDTTYNILNYNLYENPLDAGKEFINKEIKYLEDNLNYIRIKKNDCSEKELNKKISKLKEEYDNKFLEEKDNIIKEAKINLKKLEEQENEYLNSINRNKKILEKLLNG